MTLQKFFETHEYAETGYIVEVALRNTGEIKQKIKNFLFVFETKKLIMKSLLNICFQYCQKTENPIKRYVNGSIKILFGSKHILKNYSSIRNARH